MIRQERALFEMVKVLLESFEHGVSPNLIRETGKQLVPPELDIDWEK
jgi:hypothetical protein